MSETIEFHITATIDELWPNSPHELAAAIAAVLNEHHIIAEDTGMDAMRPYEMA